MKQNIFDCLVIGLGGMGSSTLYQLQKRGLQTLGLEQFTIPHEKGSSHGLSRIIRLAILSTPLISLFSKGTNYGMNWKSALIKSFFTKPGHSMPQLLKAYFQGSLQSCQSFNLPHEVLTASELKMKSPGFCLPSDFKAVFQPQGGFSSQKPVLKPLLTKQKKPEP